MRRRKEQRSKKDVRQNGTISRTALGFAIVVLALVFVLILFLQA